MIENTQKYFSYGEYSIAENNDSTLPQIMVNNSIQTAKLLKK